jgi:DNA-binding transcriptional ArsR family regulator
MVEHRARENTLTQTFAALGDPTRRAVLMELARAGETTVSALAAGFPISLNAVSKHLKVLEQAGLVQREVRGRRHFCRLRPAPLAEAARWVDTCRDFWEERLSALADVLESRRATMAPAPPETRRPRSRGR